MNNMELETDIEALDMEMGDITIHYCPVIPNPEGEPTAELKTAEIEGEIYEIADEEARTALANKVDKVDGKGLSENDFTDTLKDKLDGIEAEANKTIVDSAISPTSTNPVQNKVIYDLLNDILPEATETGNPISITNASGLNAKSLKVELEPVQDLHGYDSPWVGGGGKNKFDVTKLVANNTSISNISENKFRVTATASQNPYARCDLSEYKGKTVYISFSATRNGNFNSNLACQFSYNDGTTHYVNCGNFSDDVCEVVDKAVSIPAEAVSAIIYFTCDNSNQAEIGAYTEFTNARVCLESGQSWTPYSNICPISGRTQTVVSVNSEDITIPFNQTVYGGEVDVTSGGTSDEWGYITLDGTQLIAIKNWRPTSDSVGWIYPYNMTNNEISSSSSIVGQIIADKIKSVSYSALYNGGVGIAVYSSTSLGICIRTNDTSLTTESAINTFLSQNPITVCYKKATPTTISTPSNEISLLKGNNTLTADGDMELVYSKTPQ